MAKHLVENSLQKEPANKGFDLKTQNFRTKITPQLETHKETTINGLLAQVSFRQRKGT